MTLQERIKSTAATSASLQAQFNELNALREMVRRAEAAATHKKCPSHLRDEARGFSQ